MATYLHTCYRIGDIDRSVAFYEKLGFAEAARMPIGDEAINVFMSLPGEDPRLELTYNHGVDSYDLGTGYNHIAIAVDDLDATLEQLQYVGGVLQVFPNKRFMTGFEYMFGERENRNGQTGRDSRLQLSTQVTF